MPSSNVLGVQGRLDDIRDVAIDATVEQRSICPRSRTPAWWSQTVRCYVENSTQWSRPRAHGARLREDEFTFDVRDKMLNADGSCNISSDPLGCNTGRAARPYLQSQARGHPGPVGRHHPTSSRSPTAITATMRAASPAAARIRTAPPVTPLTRATSAEIGLASSPLPRWQTTLDVFLLKLKSELVFDGDAGVTSPSGATTRTGIEWGNTCRHQQLAARRPERGVLAGAIRRERATG